MGGKTGRQPCSILRHNEGGERQPPTATHNSTAVLRLPVHPKPEMGCLLIYLAGKLKAMCAKLVNTMGALLIYCIRHSV